MKIHHLNICVGISALLIALFAVACSEKDELSVSDTSGSTVVIRTRVPQAGAADNELINDWWLVFVDNSGSIRLLLDRPSDKTDPVDYEELEFQIPPGTYTIYAFANIDRNSLGLEFGEGKRMPDLTSVKWNSVGASGDLIPMTGVLRNVNISNEGGRFMIEVVRLWAKLCFEFSADISQDVTVSKISITPALTDAVALLPDYSSLGAAPNLPDDAVCGRLDRPVSIKVPNDGKTASETFYVLESTAAAHPSGRYPISFDLQYSDGSKRTVNALAYQLAYINRNDFVTIPVLITDWTVDFNVLFYPPIGGYPAVLSESKDDEFFAKFGSAGKFVIRPFVTAAGGSIVSDKDIEVNMTVSDPDNILNGLLSRDDQTSELIGEIKEGALGTAVVNLEIKITADVLEHRIIRKIYIIRQNS